MTENNKEKIEELVKDELTRANLITEKESIFTKAKKVLTSKTAKEFYGALAFGVAQGIMARLTFDALGNLGSENDTIIEIEE